ncbi:MAG: peptidyl-prolyl cis-trans isomerase [Alphaproteobacteria bacterium]
MLNAMRSGANSPILKFTILGFVLLAMVGVGLIGVQQDMASGAGRSSAVAKIGREKISRMEFDSIVQDALRAQKMDPKEAYRSGVPRQLLEREVSSRVLQRAASDLGLIVGPEAVKSQIDSIIEPIVKNGVPPKQAFQQVLQKFDMTETALVGALKAELVTTTLAKALAAGGAAPQLMVNDLLKYSYEWRRAEYIKLTEADADDVKPTDQQMQDYYKAKAAHFMRPEYRDFAVLVLDQKSIGQADAVSEDDLKKFYEANKKIFTQPEKRTIAQVSVADEETAKKIADAARAGKSLKSASAADKKAAFEEPKPFIEEAFIPAEVATEAFKPGASGIVGPVKGPFGWHVLDISKTVAAVSMPFDAVKADIRKQLEASGEHAEKAFQRIREIDDMVGAGKTLDDVSKSTGIAQKNFAAVTETGFDAGGRKPAEAANVPAFEKALEAAFKTKSGSVSQLIEAPGGTYLLVETRKIDPAHQKPFDEVKAEALQMWKAEKTNEALSAKADKIMGKLKLGASLDQVAAEMGKKVTRTGLIQRGKTPKDNPLPNNIMLSLFSIDQLGQSAPVAGDGSITIVRLAERKVELPQETKKEDVEALQNMLNQALQSDILEQYRQALLAKYDVTINDAVLKDMYKIEQDEE